LVIDSFIASAFHLLSTAYFQDVELTNGFAEASSNPLFVSVNALRPATATALSALFRSRSACTTSLKALITPKFA
jgi:hypothetical protein